MAVHRFQTADGKIHRVEAPTREAAEAELQRALAPAARKPGLKDDAAGALATLTRSIPFLDELNDGIASSVKTGADLLTGRVKAKSPEEVKALQGANYRAAQARTKRWEGDYAARRPNDAAMMQGVGLAAQVAPAMLTGGASAAPAIASRVAPRGMMGASARAMKPMADAAVAAGLGAQVAGYGSEGDLNERQDRANDATLPAMAIGAALPAGVMAAGKARRGAARAMRGAGKVTARLANKASGGRILDPRNEAARRLGEALRADGLGPQEVRAALETWRTSGASSPALLDLAGENTRALLRSAASKPGAARNLAVGYADQVTADLQPNALARTRDLTPDDPRSAVVAAQELAERQSGVADELYPAPYAETVGVGDDVLGALQDEPGKAALRRARAAAVARRNPQQVAEIDALLRASAEEPVDQVSGGTLDRVRIAMAGRAAKAQQAPDTRDIAGGLFSRAADIDAALDEVPGLQPARATYRGMQAQRDALERGGAQPFANPDEYADELAALTARATPDDNPYPVSADDIRGSAQVGLRSEMERMIGAPAENATGTLNRLATGTNTRRVLEDTFGGDEAGRYRDAIGREIERVSNARFVSPNTGSQTATRAVDDAMVDLPPLSKVGIAKALFDKLRRGVTLTDGERAALLELGTTIMRGADDIPRLPTTPQGMRLLGPQERARLARVLAAYEGAAAGSNLREAAP